MFIRLVVDYLWMIHFVSMKGKRNKILNDQHGVGSTTPANSNLSDHRLQETFSLCQ